MSAPPPPFDTGNQLLTALVDTPAGQRLATTVRTPSATVTVFLAFASAKAWGAQLTTAAAGMSGAGLVVAAGAVPR